MRTSQLDRARDIQTRSIAIVNTQTPGLRLGEVAALASVSTEWYTFLVDMNP